MNSRPNPGRRIEWAAKVFFLTCWFSTVLFAQSSANSALPTSSDASRQLSALLAKYVSPNGGLWNATFHFTVIEPEAVQSDVVVQIAGTENVQRTISRAGKTITSVHINGVGQTIRDGKTEVIPLWIASSSKLPEFPFPAIADRLADPATVVEVVNDESDGTLAHFKLTRLGPDGKPFPLLPERRIHESELYFDTASGHLAKEVHWLFSPSSATNARQVEVSYSDYRVADGIDVPYRITKRLGNNILTDATLVSVDLRSSNTPATF